MFKILFGFITGILFSVATIALAAVGMSIALENNATKTKKTTERTVDI